MLIGNAGRDPEMTYTPSGSAVTKFSLAVSRSWKDKATGEKKDETTWFNIIAWEHLAETCSQYIHKGTKVFVEGRLSPREYTDKNNVQRTSLDVVITQMELLGSRSDGAGQSANAGAGASSSEISGGEDFPF